jgi:hypothetical protein
MHRREILSSGIGLGVAGLAGCTDLFETKPVGGDSSGEPPVLEDRPDAVYVPTHREGMEMIGMGEAGDYTIGLMYSFPHRFWTVNGTNRKRVDIREADDVHLMATVWDAESGTVLPVDAGLTLELERDGEVVTERTPWPMLSQPMGFHYGDNFALEGDGTYGVNVGSGAMGIDRFGDFGGQFAERAATTIEFEYSAGTRDDITVESLEDRQGQRDALDVVEMEMMPTSRVPSPGELPGELLGEGTSGDATLVATTVAEPPFVDGDGAYLLVSPRTPYNRIPLPMMSLSYRLERDGGTISEGPLRAGIEPAAGYHYGTTVDGLEAGDTVTIGVDSPPQVSRHEGYETAFLEMDDVELSVD